MEIGAEAFGGVSKVELVDVVPGGLVEFDVAGGESEDIVLAVGGEQRQEGL